MWKVSGCDIAGTVSMFKNRATSGSWSTIQKGVKYEVYRQTLLCNEQQQTQ